MSQQLVDGKVEEGGEAFEELRRLENKVPTTEARAYCTVYPETNWACSAFKASSIPLDPMNKSHSWGEIECDGLWARRWYHSSTSAEGGFIPTEKAHVGPVLG